MARLWEALTPASGSATPWSHLAPVTESPSPWPAEPISPDFQSDTKPDTDPLSSNDFPNGLTALDETGFESKSENPGEEAPSGESLTKVQIAESESLWSDSEEGSAYVEVGPENEYRVSAGVEVPRFRSHFNLLTMDAGPVFGDGANPATAEAVTTETATTRDSRVPQPDSRTSIPTESPVRTPAGIPQGSEGFANRSGFFGAIAAPVIRGILERLKHHAQGDLAPWLFLSPGTGDCGLRPDGLKTVMEGIIDSISRQHGPVACLEIDAPMDGGLHSPGPGWQDLLWGRVELEEILVPGRNPLVTRIPRGDDYQPEGTWFATRSIHGVAQEIRQRFGLVVVSSISSKTDPLARFWSAQCQGWTWVASVDLWETTPLEAQARQHARGMPPWIGCVLVDRQAAAAVA